MEAIDIWYYYHKLKHMRKQKLLLPVLALIGANALWGLNTVFIKIGLETIPPHVSVSVRFLAASMILLPFALRGWVHLKKAEMFRFILSSVFTISLSSLALNIGLAKTPAFNAAVIWLIGPVLLLILSASFLKEKINLRTFIGILVAIVGSIIIIGRPLPGTNITDSMVGNLFIFLSVTFNVVAVLISKPLMKKANSYQATFLSLFPGALLVAIYAFTHLGSWTLNSVSSASMQAFTISTLIVVVSNSMFYWALKRKEAHATGVYAYVDPERLSWRLGLSWANGQALLLPLEWCLSWRGFTYQNCIPRKSNTYCLSTDKII